MKLRVAKHPCILSVISKSIIHFLAYLFFRPVIEAFFSLSVDVLYFESPAICMNQAISLEVGSQEGQQLRHRDISGLHREIPDFPNRLCGIFAIGLSCKKASVRQWSCTTTQIGLRCAIRRNSGLKLLISKISTTA